MINCKDCIHCEICDEDSKLPPQELYYCPYFKDKSKFIELPCSIGDDVWIIHDQDETIVQGYIYHIDIRSIEIQFVVSFLRVNWTDYFTADEIGKVVFFSEEEAQKKLEELK